MKHGSPTRRLKRKSSKGFTMIEMIFAIVIIGIVAISIPMIMLTNARGVEQNLLQETIFITATKLGQVLSYPWDENSPPAGTLAKTEVLNASGDDELDRNVTDYRRGHFQQALHRKMTPQSAQRSATTAGGLGDDGGDRDDIDDFEGEITLITETGERGYKKNYRINGFVDYVSDATDYSASSVNFDYSISGLGSDTNIKMVQITVEEELPSGSYSEVLRLRSYSSNIGETDYHKRTY